MGKIVRPYLKKANKIPFYSFKDILNEKPGTGGSHL
jgi:hypothetical protein